jgi:outer membrane protein OmpA-like peptidoglycan-associated protein
MVFLVSAALPAQDRGIADELESLLASEKLSCAQAARFTLEAADAAVFTDPEEAFRYALERKWLPAGSLPGSPVRLKGVALLIMRAFNLRGGVFYSLFKNPHYSYRELVYKKIILGRTDPDQTISGELFLQILGRTFSFTGETIAVKSKIVEPVPEPIVETHQPEVDEESAASTAVFPDAEAGQPRADGESVVLSDTEDIVVPVTDEDEFHKAVIYFTADSSLLAEPEQRKLWKIAGILAAMPGRKILVTGHTALAETGEGRLRMSIERAQAVADYLVEMGCDRDEVIVRGFGAARPAADNARPEGRALNRRVEITILEE